MSSRRLLVVAITIAAAATSIILLLGPNFISVKTGPTATPSTVTITTITSTTTVVHRVTVTSISSNETRLVFLGDDKFAIQSSFGRVLTYDYTRFQYSNFTFNNFTFTYREGKCENTPTGKIQILPCGSQIFVKFPSGTSLLMPSQSDSLIRQEYFRWINVGVAVINGEMENAGLLLVALDDGSQTVYVYTRH
jgi:hypothetical protein